MQEIPVPHIFYTKKGVIKIIDLETVKSYLRIDFDDDDKLLQLLIDYACNEVAIKTGKTYYLMGSYKIPIMAIIKIVSFNYEHRDSIIDKKSFIIPRYLEKDLFLLKYGE